ncbi:MAG: inositol monophosphatase family protein [Gammaproteobacteria bacterium]|nr:inositol monophosphatase family protein [Gammaproteobacteria bacterium]
MPDFPHSNLSLLKQLVVDTGKEELLPRFRHTGFSYKQDGSVITQADLSVQTRLQQALLNLSPQIPLLSEEMTEQEQVSIVGDGKASFWCLDPLDGTRNFAFGIPFFCISLALIENGQPVIAIIYDPIRDECFTAGCGQGASLNGKPLRADDAPHEDLSHCTAIIDFKRLSDNLAARLACNPPYSSQRSFGSVALDWVWLAAGRGQIYLHGKQKLWDYAAGWLILAEAGGISSTLEGVSSFQAVLEPRSAVAASNTDLYQQWFEWLGAQAKE